MVIQFFDCIVGEEMIDYITGMKFSAFFLLACGAVVKQDEALTGLQTVAKRYFNPIQTCLFLNGFIGFSLQIHLLLVQSVSSATRLQPGWCPTSTRWL